MKKPHVDGVLDAISDTLPAAEADLLARVEEQTRASGADAGRPGHPGVMIGTFCGRNSDGDPQVDFPSNPAGLAVRASTIVPLAAADVGGNVVLGFDGGDVRRPIVLGLVQPPDIAETKPKALEPMHVRVDGETVTIEAEKEVVIKCGEASITLTRAGKILIRGTYVLSRSSGANRIKGASIEMN